MFFLFLFPGVFVVFPRVCSRLYVILLYMEFGRAQEDSWGVRRFAMWVSAYCPAGVDKGF